MNNVNGKNVLITGAAMGMGKLYGQLAAGERARTIVLWDINETELEKTAAELRAHCEQVIAQVVDVSKYEAIAAAAAEVRAKVGTLDVLINNAGIIRGKYFRSEVHTSELQSLMRISYAVFCLKKKKNN